MVPGRRARLIFVLIIAGLVGWLYQFWIGGSLWRAWRTFAGLDRAMIQPFSPWYVDLLMYLPNHVPEWTVLFIVGFVSGRWIARNPLLVALAFWFGSTGYDFINYTVRSIPDIAEDPRILVIFPGPLLGIVLLWLGVQVGKRKSGRNQQPSFAVIKDTPS